MSTARALQNYLQQASIVNVSDQTIRKRLYEGGLRGRHHLVYPVFSVWHSGDQLAIAIEYQNWQNHQSSKFCLNTCDRCERLWRSCGEHYVCL